MLFCLQLIQNQMYSNAKIHCLPLKYDAMVALNVWIKATNYIAVSNIKDPFIIEPIHLNSNKDMFYNYVKIPFVNYNKRQYCNT